MGLKEELQDLDSEDFTIDFFMDAVRDKYGDAVTILDMDGDLREQRQFLLEQMTKPDNGRVTFEYCYRNVDGLLFIRKIDLATQVPGHGDE